MAALPSPNQVAGSHIGIYEAYYNIVDPGGRLGSVGASDAARFLKRSGLPDGVLGRVWDLSDPTGKGALDRTGFFVALKLVSLAQNGKEVSMAGIMTDSPPPKMGDIPVNNLPNNIIPPSIAGTVNSGSEWSIKPAEKSKYDQLFESLRPVNGLLPGNKVKGVMLNSKLPMDTLGRIWDLADMDKDGMLNRHEFTVAMHLVYKALDKHSIPNVLPPELAAPKKAEVLAHNNNNHLVMGLDAAKPPVVNPPAKPPPMVNAANAMPPPPPVASVLPLVTPAMPNWVVSAEERSKFDVLFRQTDVDKDGFVSGAEIRDVFLRYNVPQPVLAHIWSLCDTKQLGKLNSEQFALAMWLIGRKLQGVEPPTALTPEMVPPTMRPKPASVNSNATTGSAPGETAVPYSNPELEMIGKEIEELVKEKHQLESDIAQKEADIKIKSGEIKSLQSELDTLAATLKQLENQKGIAQTRLNDLSTQVDKLQKEADEQEATVKAQEEEVGARRRELEDLRQEEASLEGQLQGSKARVEDLTKHLQDAQLQISQAKAKISVLEEQKRRMGDAIATLDSALSTGDVSVVPQSVEEIGPDDFRDAEVAKLIGANAAEATDTSAANNATINEPDAFGAATSNGPVSSLADSFKDDPFRGGGMQSSNDPFGSSDPFGTSFPAPANDGFATDAFSAAFGSSGAGGFSDPFDPFGDGSGGGSIDSKTPVDMSGKDPFGCDPFAAVPPAGTNGHTPPPTAPRPESPTPALPPKKSRQPPPRPAPPKHLAGSAPGPTRAAPQPPLPTPSPVPGPTATDWDTPSSNTQDPFGADPFSGSNAGGGGGFADFANFDGKFSGKADDHSISRGDSVPVSAAWMAQQPKQDLKSLPVKSDSASPAPSANRYSELEFTEDPFRDYRYEDPFEMEDPFGDEVIPGGPNVKAGDDPFSAPRQSSSSSTDSPAFARHRGPQLPPPPADEAAPPAIAMRMAVSSTSSA